MSIETLAYTRIVMLHDVEHGNFEAARQSAGIDLPASVVSFTDLIAEDNPYNELLQTTVFHIADVLLVQDSLTQPLTDAARLAIQTMMVSSACQTRLGIFDEKYNVTMLSDEEKIELGRK